MWPFITPLNLIRYLIVWRVNDSMVMLPRCLPAALSPVLGALIADRLPTRDAQPWRKALAAWNDESIADAQRVIGVERLPKAAWPIESVLFATPGKTAYGEGELVMWELKLLGAQADHALFLEMILPAMEEAAVTSDARWKQTHSIWGRFDIHSILVARGPVWEPIVSDGRLNLDYRVTPTQWADGLTFGQGPAQRPMRRLAWVTPVDLERWSTDPKARSRGGKDGRPTTQALVAALLARVGQLLPGKQHSPDAALALLSEEEQASLWRGLSSQGFYDRYHKADPIPRGWPGRWLGNQSFLEPFAPTLLPFLELASILHVGEQTHFGCGTFILK
ncbi:MAG: hypothetical protein DWI57_16890 [Chloroflexi bacterium]|nr:MAG: hypothetical protein DWI57_16890 [Chloroflexota bacterium]